jgi:protein-tyrosine phosphatase
MTPTVVSIFEIGDYDAQIDRAAEAIRGGGVVVLPTETVYGAAGLLGSAGAVQRLGALRSKNGGDAGRPFTIHLAVPENVRIYAGELTDFERRLVRKLWPGPVGLMFEVPFERRREVAALLKLAESNIYDDGWITLRCPDHIIATDIIGRVPGPVVLTAVEGATPEQLLTEVGENADWIIEAGPSHYSKPSTLLRVKPDGYEIVRAGVYDERIIERLLRTTILFICSGNTCRSPMSEALARQILSEKLKVPPEELEKKGYIVLSAGSFAMPGAKATPQGVEALAGMGIDLSRHRSRPLSVELIHQADFIFPMSRAHAGAVTALVPSAADKVFTLDPNGDIEDPIGSELAVYESLARTLRGLIEARLAEKVPVE